MTVSSTATGGSASASSEHSTAHIASCCAGAVIAVANATAAVPEAGPGRSATADCRSSRAAVPATPHCGLVACTTCLATAAVGGRPAGGGGSSIWRGMWRMKAESSYASSYPTRCPTDKAWMSSAAASCGGKPAAGIPTVAAAAADACAVAHAVPGDCGSCQQKGLG